MKKNENSAENKIEELEVKFNETINKVYEVFGENAFRKLNDDGYENKLNRAIMDVVMIGFEKYSFEDVKRKKEDIVNLYRLILKNSEFNLLVTQATSDTKVIEKRMKTWIEKLTDVMRG